MSIFDRGDPFIQNYHESSSSQERNVDLSRNGTSVESSDVTSSWTVVTRFVLTILLRIGFVLVQVGSIPVTNVNLILLQNVVDFSCVTLAYTLAGYVIAYGRDVNGLIGEGHWIGQDSANKEEAIIGWQAIVTTSAICTSCLVGRTHTVGYLFIDFIMAGLLQPFFIHWAWTANGWMARNSLRDRIVGFRDYGGSAIVHTVGSLTGLIGCAILGRRILRLRDIDDASVSADSAGTAFAGYLLILLGLQSLCLPSTSANHSRIGGKHTSFIVTNNILGAAACSLVVVGLHFFLSREPFNHWTVMRCVQASVGGMVIISAGVDVYTPILCIGLGCSGGIVFYLVSRHVFRSALEDYCNILATHLTCALLGNIVAAFCRTSTSAEYDANTMILNVAWQVICLVTIVTVVAITMTVAFVCLECLGFLRNRSEFINHLRAVVALERGPHRSYMQRLFYPDSETLYLQPGTAPGQRLGTIVNQRFFRYERAAANIDKPKSEQLRQTAQRGSQLETVVVSSESRPRVVETRVKKLRQIHTMRSTTVVNVPSVVGYGEAMGDNRVSNFDGVVDDENRQNSKIRCSGDVADKPTSDHDALSDKLLIMNGERFDNGIGTNLKRQREPYRLHRTEKFMNLRLEAIREHDESVEFLVKPRPRSFSSTESESDEDKADRATKSNKRSCGDPITTQTSKCFDN